MKRTPLRRGTSQLKRSEFKKATYITLKGFKIPLKRSKLRVVGHSTTTELKDEIQSVLRQICLLRDKVCVLSHYKNEINPQYRECGGWKKDGTLIYQAEHLLSRERAVGFTDISLIVLLCLRHHFYYKKQYPDEYYRIVRRYIGKENSNLLTRVQEDFTPYKTDLKLELIALKQELKKLQNV